MYSARGDIQTRLDTFNAGADDFLHKPFEPRELKARLVALLRRGGTVPKPPPAEKLEAPVPRHDVPH
jgi:DNA-binding response OmpR family regulator